QASKKQSGAGKSMKKKQVFSHKAEGEKEARNKKDRPNVRTVFFSFIYLRSILHQPVCTEFVFCTHGHDIDTVGLIAQIKPQVTLLILYFKNKFANTIEYLCI